MIVALQVLIIDGWLVFGDVDDAAWMLKVGLKAEQEKRKKHNLKCVLPLLVNCL